MSKRILRTIAFEHEGPFAKVYRDSEWDEFTVKLFDASGQHMPKSDYFTSDKEDAVETAKVMVATLRSRSPQHMRTR